MPISLASSLPFVLPSYEQLGTSGNGKILMVNDHFFEQSHDDLSRSNSSEYWNQRTSPTGNSGAYKPVGGFCHQKPTQIVAAPRQPAGDPDPEEYRRLNLIDLLRDLEAIRVDCLIVNVTYPVDRTLWQSEHLKYFFGACEWLIANEGAHVRIAPQIDLAPDTILNTPAAAREIADALNFDYGDSNAWFKLDGKFFLCPFAPEKRNRDFHEALRARFGVLGMQMYIRPLWVDPTFLGKTLFYASNGEELPGWPDVDPKYLDDAESVSSIFNGLGLFGPSSLKAVANALPDGNANAAAMSEKFMWPIYKDDVRPKGNTPGGTQLGWRIDPINTKLLRDSFAAATARANTDIACVLTANDAGEGTDIWRTDRAGWSWLALVGYYGSIFRGITPPIVRNVLFTHHRPHTHQAVPSASGAQTSWTVYTGDPVTQELLEVLAFVTGDTTIRIDQGSANKQAAITGGTPRVITHNLVAGTTPRIRAWRTNSGSISTSFIDFQTAPVQSDKPLYLSYTPFLNMSSVSLNEAGPTGQELGEDDMIPVPLNAVAINTDKLVYTRSDPLDDSSAIVVRVHTSTAQGGSVDEQERLNEEMYIWSHASGFNTSTIQLTANSVAYTSGTSPNIPSGKFGFRVVSGEIHIAHNLGMTLDLKLWVQRVSFA